MLYTHGPTTGRLATHTMLKNKEYRKKEIALGGKTF